MEGNLTKDEKKHFYKRFDTLDRGVIRILSILESDDKLNKQGLVEKVSTIDIKLAELLTREKIYKAKATTWGIVGGAVGTASVWIIIWIVKVIAPKIAMALTSI